MFAPARRISAPVAWASLFGAGLTLACAGGGKSESSPKGNRAGQSAGGDSTTSGGSAGTPSNGGHGGTGIAAGTGGTNADGTGGSLSTSAGAANAGAGAGNADGGGAGRAGAASGGAGDGGRASGGGGASGAAAGAGGAVWSSTFPTFTKHTISSINSGYMTVIADIDHDGMPDVVALSSGSDGVLWFKNPMWTKHTITTSAKQCIYSAPYDVDGDGDLDLAIASDFSMTNTTSGGTLSWAECPDDPTQTEDWTLHDIGAVPTSHRLRWGDIDGDGKKELLVLPIFGMGSDPTTHAGAVALTAFTIPADPKGKWASKVLDDTHLETAHGLAVVDWDGDKAEDILTAANDGVDLFRPSLGSMAEHIGDGAPGQAPNKGSSEVGLGSLGGARFIATIDPWHGTDGVIYTPGADMASAWTRKVLGSDFEHGHGLVVADFNGDGFDEVVAGGGQGAMVQLIYRYVPSSDTWDKINLDAGSVAVSGIDVQDLNADGAPDIVSIGSSNLVWYENSH